MFPPAFVRSMLVSGTPEASGGGTFSQPPPPFVSHATARTPRAKNGKATRVGFKMEGDKKVRFAKTTGDVIDA